VIGGLFDIPAIHVASGPVTVLALLLFVVSIIWTSRRSAAAKL
jgi:hypothetical protein